MMRLSVPDLTRPSRRTFLRACAAAGPASLLAGCPPKRTPHDVDLESLAIDVHCHVFNAADLSTRGFVLCTQLPGSPIGALLQEVPSLRGVADALVSDFSDVIRRTAPDAAAEMRFLGGTLDPSQDPQQTVGPAITGALQVMLAGSPGPRAAAPPATMRARESLRRELRARLRPGADNPFAGPPFPPAPPGVPDLQKHFFGGDVVEDLQAFIEWVQLMCDFRTRIVDRLLQLYGPERRGISVFTPALVDFTRWLSCDGPADPPTVAIKDQIAVMRQVIRQRPGVHPFAPFDPRDPDVWQNAVEPAFGDGMDGSGFIGFKLYPPMGFEPAGNAQLDPSERADVNARLARLFQFCVDHDIPVMAHTNGSNYTPLGSAHDTAHPQHWLDLLRDAPALSSLRLNLAHFGPVDQFAAGHTEWQDVIGHIFDAYPNVYTDFSDLYDVSDPAFRQRFAAAVQAFLQGRPARAGRLMYGSDWNILAREAGHETYLEDWAATAPMLQPADAGFARDFFGGNARRFLGLYPGTKTWTRLQRFYAGGPAPRWFAEAPDAGGA